MLPPEICGSGKFLMPCSRMHFENFSALSAGEEAAALDAEAEPPDPPQAAIPRLAAIAPNASSQVGRPNGTVAVGTRMGRRVIRAPLRSVASGTYRPSSRPNLRGALEDWRSFVNG